jgi:FkbM family methyltransferase
MPRRPEMNYMFNLKYLSLIRKEIKKLFHLGLNKLFMPKRDYKKSYAQSGEDIIVDFIFSTLDIKDPTYLDIGSNDPIHLNNTYLFYKKGCNGVNIEPNPFIFKRLLKKRGRDVNLNVGLAAENAIKDFYIMTSKTLNTFSRETAERYECYPNQKIEEKISIEVVNVNDVISSCFRFKPNFISLDVEGLEMEILESFDFKKYRPEVFCIETLTYTEDNSEEKITEIINFMEQIDYIVHSDTYINTIFVDATAWKNRGGKSVLKK